MKCKNHNFKINKENYDAHCEDKSVFPVGKCDESPYYVVFIENMSIRKMKLQNFFKNFVIKLETK